MDGSLPTPSDWSRKIAQAILRRLARMPLADIANAIDKDESTASRLRSGEARLTVTEFAGLLATIGCKVVDQKKKCVDPEIFESLIHINMRAMRNEHTVRALLTDDDPE